MSWGCLYWYLQYMSRKGGLATLLEGAGYFFQYSKWILKLLFFYGGNCVKSWIIMRLKWLMRCSQFKRYERWWDESEYLTLHKQDNYIKELVEEQRWHEWNLCSLQCIIYILTESWPFVDNWVTFHAFWRPKFSFGNFLPAFCYFIRNIFDFLEAFDVGLLRFQNNFDQVLCCSFWHWLEISQCCQIKRAKFSKK